MSNTRVAVVALPRADGRMLHRLAQTLVEVTPMIETIDDDALLLPMRGPTRYFGGESAVVERVLAVADSVGERAAFVHADIYADDEATEIAPAVTSLKMEFEPALFVTDADGTIVQRLDAVFDADEIRAAFAAAGLD